MLKVDGCNYLGHCNGADGLFVVSFRDESLDDVGKYADKFLPWLRKFVDEYNESTGVNAAEEGS